MADHSCGLYASDFDFLLAFYWKRSCQYFSYIFLIISGSHPEPWPNWSFFGFFYSAIHSCFYLVLKV